MPIPPFLKPQRRDAGVIVTTRQSDGSKPELDEGDDGLMACAEDLIRAINAKDAQSASAALKAAFEILDSEPHNEGPHLNEENE